MAQGANTRRKISIKISQGGGLEINKKWSEEVPRVPRGTQFGCGKCGQDQGQVLVTKIQQNMRKTHSGLTPIAAIQTRVNRGQPKGGKKSKEKLQYIRTDQRGNKYN